MADFLIEDLGAFLVSLESRGFAAGRAGGALAYEKVFSDALVKRYACFPPLGEGPARVVVSHSLLKDGAPLRRIARTLKGLNLAYRRSLVAWKTRRPTPAAGRLRRWRDLQRFLRRHEELFGCFKYEVSDREMEGNHLFNLHVPSTPSQRGVCMELIEALADADLPLGVSRGRREADPSVRQRNGWIQRFTRDHRKRGWHAAETVRRIQKELRDGTWNERSRLRYNIAESTIFRIAGMKAPRFSRN